MLDPESATLWGGSEVGNFTSHGWSTGSGNNPAHGAVVRVHGWHSVGLGGTQPGQ